MALCLATVILWPTPETGAGRGYNKAAPMWAALLFLSLCRWPHKASSDAQCVREEIRKRGLNVPFEWKSYCFRSN